MCIPKRNICLLYSVPQSLPLIFLSLNFVNYVLVLKKDARVTKLLTHYSCIKISKLTERNQKSFCKIEIDVKLESMRHWTLY